MIALEPEAASLFFTAKKLNEPGSVSEGAELSQSNTHYIIVDIGGKCVVHVSVVTIVCVSKVVKLPDPGDSAACDCCPKSLCSPGTNSAIQAELRIRDKSVTNHRPTKTGRD